MRRAAALALVTLGLAAIPAAASLANTEEKVLATRHNEMTPAADNGILGWTAIDSRGLPHATVRLSGKSARKIGNTSHQTWLGGIDGTLVVLQDISGSGSDIRAYNATTGRRVRLPAAAASSRWEYAPTVSGGRVWFLKAGSGNTDGLLLTISTGRVHRVVRMPASKGTLQGGQLTGGFLVYGSCHGGRCSMKRYELATKTIRSIPRRSGRYDVAPGVADDGTVYFWRSRVKCGDSVYLMRWRPGSTPAAVLRLPSGIDAGKTYVFRAGNGIARVYYERYHCTSSGRSAADLYRIADLTDPAHPPAP